MRQSGDDPDRLALLVEALRHVLGHYGEWTALPAPYSSSGSCAIM